MEKNIRSFIAIDLPQALTEKLYQLSLNIKSKIKDLRPIPPQNIHLTLKFLGNTQESLIEKIKGALDETVKDFKKINIKLENLGAFPNFKSPRVFWVAPEGEVEKIKQLKEKLDNQLSLLGIQKDERAFKTHITIARLKSKKAGLDFEEILSNSKLDIKDKITIEAIHLYQSTLTPKGPIYTKLHSSKLKS